MTTNDQNINLDKRLEALISKISKMEEEVVEKEKNIGKVTWITSLQPKNASFKTLHVATTPEIVEFITFLFSNKEAKKKALTALGLDSKDFDEKYDGYLISDWVSDAKQRVALNEIKAMKDKIKVSKVKIENLKSEVQKRNDGIANLEKELDF